MEQLVLLEQPKVLTDFISGKPLTVEGSQIASVYWLTKGRRRATAVVLRDGDKYEDLWVAEEPDHVRKMFGITRAAP